MVFACLEQFGVAVVVATCNQDLASKGQLGELIDRSPLTGPGQERRRLDHQGDARGRVVVLKFQRRERQVDRRRRLLHVLLEVNPDALDR